MSLQTVTIVCDTPDDNITAVESAAAAAVQTMQDAGVTVTAASFGGTSLLPTPGEQLRDAIDALRTLAGGKPSAADLQAAVARVDDAARVVEAAGPPTAPAGVPGHTSVALPDDGGTPAPVDVTPAPAAPVDVTPAPVDSDTSAGDTAAA